MAPFFIYIFLYINQNKTKYNSRQHLPIRIPRLVLMDPDPKSYKKVNVRNFFVAIMYRIVSFDA